MCDEGGEEGCTVHDEGGVHREGRRGAQCVMREGRRDAQCMMREGRRDAQCMMREGGGVCSV